MTISNTLSVAGEATLDTARVQTELHVNGDSIMGTSVTRSEIANGKDGPVTMKSGLHVSGGTANFPDGVSIGKFLSLGSGEHSLFRTIDDGSDANRSTLVFSGQSYDTGTCVHPC